jgi:hypothetical protein
MNFKRGLYLVVVALLFSSVLPLGANPALAGPDPNFNRLYNVAVKTSACNGATGYLTVTTITDTIPGGYNSVTAHAVGSPDTFIYDIPNGAYAYTHDIRYTAPSNSLSFIVEVRMWWTDFGGSRLVASQDVVINCGISPWFGW